MSSTAIPSKATAAHRPFVSRKPTKDPKDYIGNVSSPEVDKLVNQGNSQSNVTLAQNKETGDLQVKSKSLSKKERKQFRDVTFAAGTTAFDIHNPSPGKSSFHGFYTLFWLAHFFLVVKTILVHWRTTGHFFRGELISIAVADISTLFWSDAFLVWSSVFVYFLQLVMFYFASWNKIGWIIENIWQTSYLCATVYWAYARNWPWIQTVFIVLHCIVMLMKQHSYASYMGYLSEVYRKKAKLEKRLVQVKQNSKNPSISVTAPESVDKSSAVNEPLAPEDANPKPECREHTEQEHLVQTIADLAEELTHDGVTYPENLTLWNYIDYLLVPSLVYDITYPRTEKIRWSYVLEKTAATFGTFFLMLLISEHYVLAILPKNLATMTTNQKLAELPWMGLEMVFPFISLYLLTFYIIFECVCQWFAEVTRFADRTFYNEWWNALSWDDFARDWNVPVHRFLLRHVYHSSMSTLKVKKQNATLITFFLSSCVHEMVMACMTKKLRMYLLCSQMLQLPLTILSRTKIFKANPLLANLFFWFGIFVGPTFLCLGYVMF